VVDYAIDNPKVTLSLRQADILHALAHDEELCDEGGCVPDLQRVEKSRYVTSRHLSHT
jgi:glutamate--cysteine ligase catalytic subunit